MAKIDQGTFWGPRGFKMKGFCKQIKKNERFGSQEALGDKASKIHSFGVGMGSPKLDPKSEQKKIAPKLSKFS